MEALVPRFRRPRRETTLADFLLEVPASAGVLIGHLSNAGALQSARLSCKALRQFIDDNVERLKFNVSEIDLHWCAWTQDALLTRWPHCSSVNVFLKLPELASDWSIDRLIANMAALPFMGLGPAARARIHRVSLDIGLPLLPSYACRRRYPEIAVRSVVSLLPQLRVLDLQHVPAMSYEVIEQRLMFESLAALPHLEGLVLPSDEALDHISTLANGPSGCSLKRLTVKGLRTNSLPMSPAAARGLSRLAGLEKLELEVQLTSEDAQLRLGPTLKELLDSLPPSLKELRLFPRGDRLEYRVFRFGSGRLSGLDVVGIRLCAPAELESLAAQVLASRVMAGAPQQHGLVPQLHAQRHQQQVVQGGEPQQQQHRLESMLVNHIQLLEDVPLEVLAMPAVRELLRRCQKVTLDSLFVSTPQQAAVMFDMFGKPVKLFFQSMAYATELDLLEDEESPDLAPPQQDQDQAPAAVLPSMEEVAHLLVRRLLGEEEETADPAAAASSGAAAACPSSGGSVRATDGTAGEAGATAPYVIGASTASGTHGGAGSGRASAGTEVAAGAGPSSLPPRGLDYSSSLLLLRGGFIRLLGSATDLLASWVDRMRDESAIKGDTAAGAARLVSFIVLPGTTSAAIIDCGTAAGAAALAAVIREAGKGELEVLPVATEMPREEYDEEAEGDSDFAAFIYCQALSNVLQQIWDARWRTGAAAAVGERAVLLRLLELSQEVRADVGGSRWVDGTTVTFAAD